MAEFINKIQNKDIIVFGFGKRGNIIDKLLPCNIKYYVDNDPAKWHMSNEAKLVCNPLELLFENKASIFIIVVSYYYKPILWQLEEMGFRENVHFINGLDLFGDVLDELSAQKDQRTYDVNKVWLRGNCKIEGQCHFAGNNVVSDQSQLVNTTMQRYSTMGKRCTVYETQIGQFCSVGSEVIIGLDQHPSSGFISTYGAFYLEKPTGTPSFVHKQLFREMKPVLIGNDVWIGSRAIILGGVNIGDGAIVGAGAIVTKNVAPYSIVAGVPARLIRKRYSSEWIKKLLDFAWWNKDIEWIRRNANAFSDEKAFFQLIDNDNC